MSQPRARDLAAATPASRDRYVDLLRAFSLTAVVVGHWLAVTIVVVDGRIQGRHVLEVLPSTHLLTWGFQVMGLFFLVGGFANAASWSSAQRHGHGYAGWLHGRGMRLLTPTTVFLAVGASVAAGLRLAGVDPELVRLGAWLIAIPVWFLAVYLVVVALAPVMLAAHRRWGLAVPAALAVLAALGDVARFATGEALAAAANFVVVWLIAHQLGIAWREGALTGGRRPAWLLFGGGLTALLVATTVGPYPVSMVAYPGAPLQNTSPPTLALLALIITHTGLALLLAAPVRRWLRRRRVWTVVVALNAAIMTIFLWHMVPVVVAALALYPTGIMPDPEIGAASWFALRPVWLAVCGLLLAGLVAIFVRAERPPPARSRAPGPETRPAVQAVLGVATTCAGIAMLTTTGLQGGGPAGLPLPALTTYAIGFALLATVPAARRSPLRGSG